MKPEIMCGRMPRPPARCRAGRPEHSRCDAASGSVARISVVLWPLVGARDGYQVPLLISYCALYADLGAVGLGYSDRYYPYIT